MSEKTETVSTRQLARECSEQRCAQEPKRGNNSKSISGWADNQDMVCPYNGVLSPIKRNEVLTWATTWMNLGSTVLNGAATHRRTNIV